MKKLLYLTKDYPYPISNGYRVRVFHQIERLSGFYDLTLVIITLGNRENCTKSRMEKVFPRVKDIIIIKLSNAEIFRNITFSIFQLDSIEKNILKSKEAVRLLKHLRPDILFVSTIRLVYLSKQIKSEKKFLDLVDLISENYKKSTRNTSDLIKRGYFLYEKIKLARYEKHSLSYFSKVFLINPKEVEDLQKRGCPNLEMLSNGVQLGKCNQKVHPRTISMLGPLDYHPNLDALLFLIKELGDFLQREDIVINYIGNKTKNAPKHPSINYLGFVDDPRVHICRTECFVAPMINGAGVQNKILEAMANGKIVLTTDIAAAPIIGVKNNTNIKICNTPKDFESALKEIIIDKVEVETIQKNAKELMRQNYNWDKIIHKNIFRL